MGAGLGSHCSSTAYLQLIPQTAPRFQTATIWRPIHRVIFKNALVLSLQSAVFILPFSRHYHSLPPPPPCCCLCAVQCWPLLTQSNNTSLSACMQCSISDSLTRSLSQLCLWSQCRFHLMGFLFESCAHNILTCCYNVVIVDKDKNMFHFAFC